MEADQAIAILRDRNVGYIKNTEREEIAGAILQLTGKLDTQERCLRGFCCFCENARIRRVKCLPPVAVCPHIKEEIPWGMQVKDCKFWKFRANKEGSE